MPCPQISYHKNGEKLASPERGGGPPLGGGEVFSCNLLCNVLECIFDICGDPSVSAAHCQLLLSGPFCHFVTFPHSMGNHPFQGSLIFFIFLSCEIGGHGTPCPYKIAPRQLEQPYGATVLKAFCSCTMRFQTKKDTAHRVLSPHLTNPAKRKMPESLCFRAFESGDPYGN